MVISTRRMVVVLAWRGVVFCVLHARVMKACACDVHRRGCTHGDGRPHPRLFRMQATTKAVRHLLCPRLLCSRSHLTQALVTFV